MTTLELLAEISDVMNRLDAGRRDQDWLECQHEALQLAHLFRQLQVEQKLEQRDDRVSSKRFREFISEIRRVVS